MISPDLFIDGIGLLGPGLHGWDAGAAVLSGAIAYAPAATQIPVPEKLAAAERRRTGRVARLALAVGFEATSAAAADVVALPTVFASSGGDGDNCHEICEVLASPDRALSPTRFHNSVHNAPSGYWSIVAASMAPANVLCAYDASFAAGLIEALAQISVVPGALLLVVYDAEYPPPLYAKRPIPDAFAVAMVLSSIRGAHSFARLQVRLGEHGAAIAASGMDDPRLHALQQGIPAARSLPLLQALARRTSATVALEYLAPLALIVQVEPC